MATFKDIDQANKTIRTTNIKGKQYAEVNQRIKAFRMLYPEGFIRTNIVSHAGDIVIIKAEAGYIDEAGAEHVLGTGTAFEDKSKGMINGTSYIENCETSAVGRALGMIGLGIDMSIASFEEVNNAMAQQEAKKKAQAPAADPEPQPEPIALPFPIDEEIITCAECGKPIQATANFTAAEIAQATKDQLGKEYCITCGHKIGNKRKKQEETA